MIETSERRSHFVIPTLLAFVVVPLALTLLVVGARSPYTHANLMASYDPAYTRTDQVLVGAPAPYGGMMGGAPVANDPVELGHQLFVVKECAACHGLDGLGGVVGPSIAGMKFELLRQVTQKGMGGMPAFAPEALSDADLRAIAAYLEAMRQAAPAAPTSAPSVSSLATPLPAQVPAGAPTLVKPGAGTGQKVDAAKIAEGKSVYAQNCSICHGDKGDGKGPFAAGATPAPANFTDASDLAGRTPQQWFDTVTKGKGTMPAFESNLTDDQRWAVVDYIWTFSSHP